MKKLVLIFAMVLMVAVAAIGCSKSDPLVIWVGVESKDFYEAKMQEYVTNYNATHDKDFPFVVEVKAVDTGSAAATFLDDTDAGADIFTVAHDNLGKLIAGSSAIAPVTNPALLAQINADNPESFLTVIRGAVDGTTYTFGVPYVAQSLVLYYNTKFITPTQAETWEGIWGVAKAQNKQSLSITGADGFNNSFLLLATNAQSGLTSLRLYQNGVQENSFGTGDDTISILKWGQRFFTDPNGAKAPTDSGWEVELKDEISLSVIGGAWHFKAAQSALGTNLGITILPRFTITEADAYGTIAAGTEFQSGSFTDTKMFVMKKGSTKAEFLQDILLYLSSVEMQEASFIAADNLPAYKNAVEEFESMKGDSLAIKLAVAQIEMFNYGIPQPFGFHSRYNVYYYSKGAPELIMAILRNTGGAYNTHADILAQMQIVETIWKTGSQ